MTETVTLQIPESIYRRLVNTARATKRPLQEVMIHALKVGSPPAWDNVPNEFQVELAALDRMEDEALWTIAQSRKTAADMERYNTLLERKKDNAIADTERIELTALRTEADLFMLRKAQAAALLRWRGYHVISP
jgi:paraquat-inducible protein B